MPYQQASNFSTKSYMPSPENKYRPYAHKVPLNSREESFNLTQANTTYLSNLTDLKVLDFDEKLTTKELATYAGIRYLTTGLVFPFHVGETLLQVQYLPSEEHLINSSLEEERRLQDEDSDDPEFYDVNLDHNVQNRG
ncbi:hypothetical protein K7432_002165 [Basidiobolus ranarum]|uniref:Uncharacterized protein n=1 Tax=Basidiobolus ranarum TaxID=34480 RepID=A0ABR2W883_9FUNG